MFATDAGFSASLPFRVMCTVNARWSELANSGSARSALYQVTPNGASAVLTRVPDAPTVTAADGALGSAKVDLRLGETYGSTVTGYTVTPYLYGSAQSPIEVPIEAGQPAPIPGSTVSVTVPASSGTYRYSVSVDVAPSGTSATVRGASSSLTMSVTVR
jgi:hypothetical protein